MTSPEEIKNWGQYLLKAVRRETGEKWNQPQYQTEIWEKQLKKLANNGVNPYLLALGIDLLALQWGSVRLENIWTLTTVGVFLKAFRDVAFPIWYWKGVYFSRFCNKEQEKHYRHLLRQAQIALTMGVPLKSVQEAKEKLKNAESKLRASDAKDVFVINWLADWRKTWK